MYAFSTKRNLSDLAKPMSEFRNKDRRSKQRDIYDIVVDDLKHSKNVSRRQVWRIYFAAKNRLSAGCTKKMIEVILDERKDD